MLENEAVYSEDEDDDNDDDILNYITESDEEPGDTIDVEEESEDISALFVSTRSGRKTTSWKSFLYK